jgi:hypothetical protein
MFTDYPRIGQCAHQPVLVILTIQRRISETAPSDATLAAQMATNQSKRLMIALVSDLAAKHPVGPSRIT